jgi:hypothetical protein
MAAAGAAIAAATARVMSFLFIVFSAVVKIVKDCLEIHAIMSCEENSRPGSNIVQHVFQKKETNPTCVARRQHCGSGGAFGLGATISLGAKDISLAAREEGSTTEY